jgi:mannose-6-phosphate isomerase-like protein (cupin superfamily)
MVMGSGFDTMRLPPGCDAIAPDGSCVRVLLRLGRGGMAHFELGVGRISRTMAHHHVEEIWYIVGGRGEMWRRDGDRQETVPLAAGTCVSIPTGTHFQFRSVRDIATAMLAAGPVYERRSKSAADRWLAAPRQVAHPLAADQGR